MFMDEVPLFVSGERKAKHKTRMATPVRSGVPTPESDVGPEVSEVFCGRVEGDAGTGAVLEGDGVAGDDAVEEPDGAPSEAGLESAGVGEGVASGSTTVEVCVPEVNVTLVTGSEMVFGAVGVAGWSDTLEGHPVVPNMNTSDKTALIISDREHPVSRVRGPDTVVGGLAVVRGHVADDGGCRGM
jgi:hypothetical protein